MVVVKAVRGKLARPDHQSGGDAGHPDDGARGSQRPPRFAQRHRHRREVLPISDEFGSKLEGARSPTGLPRCSPGWTVWEAFSYEACVLIDFAAVQVPALDPRWKGGVLV
jgi:hypothetical protein